MKMKFGILNDKNKTKKTALGLIIGQKLPINRQLHAGVLEKNTKYMHKFERNTFFSRKSAILATQKKHHRPWKK